VHLPPHSWEDLIQYKSIAGELWVNDQFQYHFLPGTYSILSAIEYITDDKPRLISDLIESLDEDNLQQDSGVIVLDEDDKNIFKLNGKDYLVEKMEDYEDPMFENVEGTSLEGKLRIYGTKLTYIGEEILDLALDIPAADDVEELFEYALSSLKEDRIRFRKLGKAAGHDY